MNGKTLHVVQRLPPRASNAPEGGATPSANTSRNGNQGNTFVLGSFTLPSDVVDPNQVQVWLIYLINIYCNGKAGHLDHVHIPDHPHSVANGCLA